MGARYRVQPKTWLISLRTISMEFWGFRGVPLQIGTCSLPERGCCLGSYGIQPIRAPIRASVSSFTFFQTENRGLFTIFSVFKSCYPESSKVHHKSKPAQGYTYAHTSMIRMAVDQYVGLGDLGYLLIDHNLVVNISLIWVQILTCSKELILGSVGQFGLFLSFSIKGMN